MEISDVEQMVMACNFDVVSRTEKNEQLDIIGGIIGMRNYQGRFNHQRWAIEFAKNNDVMDLYGKYIKGTLEDRIAKFAITLFSLANKYKMNMKSLRLNESPGKLVSFEDLQMSMLKITLSHYRIYKKIIVLIGMLCDYCIANSVDLVWFTNKRLLAYVK